MTSRDGYSWTKKEGLQPGIPCIGVIQPPSNISVKDRAQVFDVIVVGAGYAGLTAAREASITGLKVLLLEARDRIGGRSWSSNINGCPYELGGTWVHWGQAAVWREIVRYGMQDELESGTTDESDPDAGKFLLASAGAAAAAVAAVTETLTRKEEESLMEAALTKLFDVDGAVGRLAVSAPYSTRLSDTDRQYDRMSAADRLAEMADNGNGLTPAEHACAAGFTLLASGGTLDTTSFYELLRWWALCGHTYVGCVDRLMRFKFRGGQSSFALRLWTEALRSGNMRYAFSSPVARVRDDGCDVVQVETRTGATFTARRMISAVPLTVLRDIDFDPPLNKGKTTAARLGHVNQTIKVHAEVRDSPHLRCFTALRYPDNGLVYAIGDGETPAGNTHLLAFGGQNRHFHPEDDISHTIAQLNGFTPMQVERLVFHNWSRDEFSKGAWFFPAPGLISSYLNDLRVRQGNIFFASSDWAAGWRGFIDGAIEEGTRAAADLGADLIGYGNI